MRQLESWEEFVEIVKRHFSFLTGEFGYAMTSNAEPMIVYESASLQVVVFSQFGARYGLDIRIEPLDTSPYGDFSLQTWRFECLHRGNWAVELPSDPPDDADEIESFVREKADQMNAHCSAVLRGDLEDVRRLQILEEEFKKRFTADYQRANGSMGHAGMANDLMNRIIKEQHWE